MAEQEALREARKGALRQALIQKRLKKSATENARNSRISCCDTLDNIPLSSAQKRIWLMQQLEPDVPFANRPLGIRLKGPLDQQILSKSLTKIVHRHEALRTIFPIKNGAPIQQILSPWTVVPKVLSLRHFPDQQREAEARKRATLEAQKTFDLAVGPLMRPVLFQLSEAKHILFLFMHHIVFDGWSEGLLLSELRNLYDAMDTSQEPNLPELPIQYKDFTLWQEKRLRETALVQQLSYWQQRLDKLSPVLDLLTDYPRSDTRTFRAG